jgi:peroxiredoxin Q/BCP
MSDWIEAGQEAPDFTLPADSGKKVTLSKLRGQPVVLYFYPRDDTPGCTAEACAFRDQKAELAQVAEKYGAWREKTRFGKTSMGVQRSTFLIDAKGAVQKVWKSVTVENHDRQVLEALDAMA